MRLKEINIPHSLGWYYSAFTEFLGWNPNEGEVKLMGLAPFGEARPMWLREGVTFGSAGASYRRR